MLSIGPGGYNVTESSQFGYTSTFSEDCSGSIAAGETKMCTVTNNDPDTSAYAPYCGDGEVNQSWETCDGGPSCTAQCQNENQCTDKVFARAVITNVSNTGDGDMTNDVFLGGDNYATNRIPSGTWFLLNDGISDMTDPDMGILGWPAWWADVPGLAVERQAGQIRTHIDGNHKHNGVLSGSEHVEGYLEFFNTSPLAQNVDTVYPHWVLENPNDTLMTMADTQDEMWLENEKSYFWMTTSPHADGFFTTYSTHENSCSDENDNGGGGDNNADEQIISGGPSWTPPSAGQVLGVSTTNTDEGKVLGEQASCGIYLSKYIRYGRKNDAGAVKKLQTFLNDYLHLSLPVNGIYTKTTETAVKQFQLQHMDKVLAPWKINKPTGIVYLTTVAAINNIICPDLNLPVPNNLIPFSQNNNIL
jgi:hypothetical protein